MNSQLSYLYIKKAMGTHVCKVCLLAAEHTLKLCKTKKCSWLALYKVKCASSYTNIVYQNCDKIKFIAHISTRRALTKLCNFSYSFALPILQLLFDLAHLLFIFCSCNIVLAHLLLLYCSCSTVCPSKIYKFCLLASF